MRSSNAALETLLVILALLYLTSHIIVNRALAFSIGFFFILLQLYYLLFTIPWRKETFQLLAAQYRVLLVIICNFLKLGLQKILDERFGTQKILCFLFSAVFCLSGFHHTDLRCGCNHVVLQRWCNLPRSELRRIFYGDSSLYVCRPQSHSFSHFFLGLSASRTHHFNCKYRFQRHLLARSYGYSILETRFASFYHLKFLNNEKFMAHIEYFFWKWNL